jgi:hypothetical protein
MTTQREENYYVNTGLTPLPVPHLTGMKLQEDISLNDFVFNRVDEFGVVWVITNIEGWWTMPSPDIPDFKRGWGDGAYDVQGRYNARDLTLEGVFLTSDPALVAAARNRLVSAINLVRGGAWLKTNENPTKASFVRLSGEVNIDTVNARGRTEFSIGLRAADPIKYEWNDVDIEGYRSREILAKSAASPVRSGSATVENIGNYPVATYLTVEGPIVGPAFIDNTTNNETITISGSLRAATTKVVNGRGLLDNLATVGTTTAHGLIPGDLVTISGIGAPYDGQQLVLSIIGTSSTSTQFTFEATGTNFGYSTTTGSLAYGPDTLEIDTYNRQVFLNGQYSGARTKLDVYNEYVTLAPGVNTIVFSDAGAPSSSAAKLTVQYRSGWLA